MQAEQRAKIGEERFEPRDQLWQPFTVHGEDGDDRRKLDVAEDDTYVVVEDIEDGRIVLEISMWPRLDQDGRLFFAADPTELYDDLETAQGVIDQARAGQGITAPDRSVRIGDVYAARGLPPEATALSEAETIWDISLAGRNAAKAALYGAAASTVEESYAADMAITGDLEEAEPEPGEYDVLQQTVASKPSPVQLRPGRDRGELT